MGPKLYGVFDTLQRVKHLEGFSGFYKGVFFAAAQMIALAFCSVIFVGTHMVRDTKGTISFPKEAGLGMAFFALAMTIISLPLEILTNRAIITPYRLPMSVPKSLEILLSVHERSRPWMLYFTPGLLAAIALQTLSVAVVGGLWRGMLMADGNIVTVAMWRVALVVIFQLLSTLWLCPIQVIITKLSVQPNLGGEISVEDPEGDVPEGLRFAGQGEDVVGLRPTTEPYLGFVDAVRKIKEEEGWPTLYRAWWFTALMSLARL